MKYRNQNIFMTCAVAVGVGLGGERAHAADVLPTEVDWSTLRALIIERSADLAYQRALIEVAATARVGVSAYANPTLDVGVLVHAAGTNTFDTAQPSIGISQPLRLVGKEGARRRAAEAMVKVAEADASRFETELLVEARRMYVALQVAQEKERAAIAMKDEVTALEAIVSGRVRGGVASQYDANKVAREVAQVEMLATESALEVELASRDLAVLLAVVGWSPRAGEPLAMGALEVSERRLESHPELVRAVAAESAAQAQTGLVERERWPDLVVSAGVAMTTDDFGVAPYVGASIDLMVFDRQREALARGRAEAIAAQREREVVERRLGARVAAATDAVQRRRAALSRWDELVGKSLGTLGTQAREAYQSGRIELIDLLDTLRSEGESRMTRIDLMALVLVAELELAAARGGDGL